MAAIVLSLSCALSAQPGNGYLIATVAGNGVEGFSGDGGQAILAEFWTPNALAVDPSGNIYVADSINSRIRKITPDGKITTFAGNGSTGFSGDGGPAVSAQISQPQGVAADLAGNVFIAGSDGRIRKVTPGGIIQTVAGNSTPGRAGCAPAATSGLGIVKAVAVDSSGNLYVGSWGWIFKVSTNGTVCSIAGNGSQSPSGDDGPATAAGTGMPDAIALDPTGNLYIADSYNNRLRKILPNGIITSVVAPSLLTPFGIVADSSGSLFVADSTFGRVLKLASDGTTAVIAGGGQSIGGGDGGPATRVTLAELRGMALDSAGDVYVIEAPFMTRIRKLVPTGASVLGCVYSIDTINQNVMSAGGSSTVGVLASASSCPWLAVSYSDWIAISPSRIGTGTGLVSYTVASNPNSASRTGTVWIAGQSLTINQTGVVCSLTVNPRSIPVSAAGVTGSSLTVASNASDCTWIATANVPWILVSGGTPGTGSGTVNYTVGVNTGGLRTGTMTVAGHTVYINQLGQSDSASSLASITTNGVVNAASNTPVIAPGSLVTIYGQNFASATATWDSAIVNGQLPTSLGGVQVRINGKAAFINYVQAGQVNVLAPADTATSHVDVDVITAHGTATATATMASTSPALFTYTVQGTVYAASLFGNEATYVAPIGSIPGVTSRPAKPGDYILLYATGLGQTTPPYPVGQVISGAYWITDLSQVHVLIGGQPATVFFAGVTFAGVFQINIQVPSGIGTGDLPLVVQIAGQPSQQGVFLNFGQ